MLLPIDGAWSSSLQCEGGEEGDLVGTEQAGMAVQSKPLIPPSLHVLENSLADETAATYN